LHFSALFLRPPSAPPFPYTTLFRSEIAEEARMRHASGFHVDEAALREDLDVGGVYAWRAPHLGGERHLWSPQSVAALQKAVRLRSEEHTSELQSRENLVCRLLLEKK